MLKSFENGARTGFTHEEAVELKKTGCVADPNDSSAYYVTGAYLTEEQKTWDDGDLRKNEEFSLSGIYWWGDDSVYICDISDLDEEIEAYDDLRELICLGWTPESFDKDFDTHEGADWDKSQKEEYRRIFMQAWEDAQEEMKEAQEKQEKKITYQVMKTWGQSNGNVGCDIMFESPDINAAIAELNRVKGEEAGAEYCIWVDADGIGHKYNPEEI